MKLLTHSSMQTFKNCRMRYYYRYILKLVRKGEDPDSLLIGTAFHRGLELYYSNVEEEQCVNIAVKELLEAIEDRSEWQQYQYDNEEKRCALVKAMLLGYFKHFNDRDSFNEIRPEFEFCLPVINPATGHSSTNYKSAGKMDGLFQTLAKQWWLREFKTAAQVDKSYIDKLALDHQITNYIDAGQKVLDVPVVGVIYTICKKPSIRQKQTETVKEYCDRLIADYQERPDFYFYQEYVYRSKKDIADWEQEKWDIQKDISEAVNKERFYRNTSYCAQFGGCPYMPLCLNGEDALPLYEQKQPHSELSNETKEKYLV